MSHSWHEDSKTDKQTAQGHPATRVQSGKNQRDHDAADDRRRANGSKVSGDLATDFPRATTLSVAAPIVRDDSAEAASLTEALVESAKDASKRRLRSEQGEIAGWLASLVIHFVLLFGLGLLLIDVPRQSSLPHLIAGFTQLEPLDFEPLVFEPTSPARLAMEGLVDRAVPPLNVELPLVSEQQHGDDSLLQGPLTGTLGVADRPVEGMAKLVSGGGLEGRSPQARTRLALSQGGSPASEAAVERGLRWLMVHQCADGSWHFNHWDSPNCNGYCRNPGTAATTTGATGVVLMAFLGAGYTHKQGPYKDTVQRGLYYLLERAQWTPEGADLQEGTMYGQGLATIAICEAYAMTGDLALKRLAEEAVRFIDHAQDKQGGGWRYHPGQAGDTTVTGWQLMALKSAQLAGIHFRSPTVALVDRFLDSVQAEDGAQYGYIDREPGRTTTAIGLLCRMYTGWPRSHPGLKRGVELLAEWGPSRDNMYYNYYATQVMRHWGGPLWERWNHQMRDYLIATQSRHGHEAGSWYFPGGRLAAGGRIVNTAFAVMTLEVYYRYLPLYQPKAFQAKQRAGSISE